MGVPRWFFWRTELNSLGSSLRKYWGSVFEAALQLPCGSSVSCEQATTSLWPTDPHWHNQIEQEFITDSSPRFKELKRKMHITLSRVPYTCSVPNKKYPYPWLFVLSIVKGIILVLGGIKIRWLTHLDQEALNSVKVGCGFGTILSLYQCLYILVLQPPRRKYDNWTSIFAPY